jgi:hypothetical protein
VDQGEGEDQQRPRQAEAVDPAAHFGGVAAHRGLKGAAQVGHRKHERREHGDSRQGQGNGGK